MSPHLRRGVPSQSMEEIRLLRKKTTSVTYNKSMRSYSMCLVSGVLLTGMSNQEKNEQVPAHGKTGNSGAMTRWCKTHAILMRQSVAPPSKENSKELTYP